MRFQTYLNEQSITYEQYIQFLNSYPNIDESLASLIPGIFREIKDVISKIVNDFKADVSDIIDALKNREVFNLMKIVGFRMTLRLLKSVSSLLSAPVNRAFKELHQTRAFDTFRNNRQNIKDFLDKHPILRKFSGVFLAGLIVFIWVNMTFIGSLDFDMDLSIVSDSIKGSYTIEDFLASHDLLKYATLFLTGYILGISCAWLGHSIYNLILAISYTTIKKQKPQVASLMVKVVKFGIK